MRIGTYPKWLAKIVKWCLKTIWHKKVTMYGRGSRLNCPNTHKDLYWKRAERVAVYIK